MRNRRLVVCLAAAAVWLMPVDAPSQVLPSGDDLVGTVTLPSGDTVGTVEDTVGSATSTVGSVVGTASGSAGSVTASGGSATSPDGGGTTDPGTTSTRSRAAGHGGQAAPGPAYRSRFDRLPTRVELLLERIELGRHVRANLRRLEALLARSPALRARVLRALKAERTRLAADGLTARERRQLQRLRLVEEALRGPSPGPSPFMGRTPSGAPLGSSTIGGAAPALARQTGTRSAEASSKQEGQSSGSEFLPPLPFPGADGTLPSWVFKLLPALWLALLALVLGVKGYVRRKLRET